jgi:hypothetical protein
VIHVAHAAWPYVLDMIGVTFVCPERLAVAGPDTWLKKLPGAEEYAKSGCQQLFLRPRVFRHGVSEPAARKDVQEYQELGFSDEVYAKVMGKNALRLMKMDLTASSQPPIELTELSTRKHGHTKAMTDERHTCTRRRIPRRSAPARRLTGAARWGRQSRRAARACAGRTRSPHRTL